MYSTIKQFISPKKKLIRELKKLFSWQKIELAGKQT